MFIRVSALEFSLPTKISPLLYIHPLEEKFNLLNSGERENSIPISDNQDNLADEELIEIGEELSTQIDRASIAPIFDDFNDFDEFEDDDDDEEFDYNKVKVSHLRRMVAIKGLSQKFKQKLGKTPRSAKKAELVKFLSTTSIFDD